MRGKEATTIYPDVPPPPVPQIAMPRAPRIYAPGETVPVVARCNNREFNFTAPEEFKVFLDHLREMARTYEVKLFGHTLMCNHVLC